MAKMNDFRIIIGNDIFTFDTSASIALTVYVDYKGKAFPNNQWNDFPEAVLGMWIYNLIKNKESSDVKLELYFMDGPYRLDVIKDNNMLLTINCIADRATELTEMTFACSYREFMVAMYDAFKSFGSILYSNGLHKGRFEATYRQSLKSMDEIKYILESL